MYNRSIERLPDLNDNRIQTTSERPATSRANRMKVIFYSVFGLKKGETRPMVSEYDLIRENLPTSHPDSLAEWYDDEV